MKFHEIRSVGVESFHADRRTDEQTDMTKLIVPCRNFANSPKDEISKGYSGNRIINSLLNKRCELLKVLLLICYSVTSGT